MKCFIRLIRGVVLAVAIVVLPAALLYAAAPICTPVSAEMCAAIDDVADVWINNNFIGTFNYVNWDQTGVYPTCMTFNVSILSTTGNVVALDVENTACCEIWGSWSIEVNCADGSHSCLSSDDTGMRLFNVETPSSTPPPNDGDGDEWWEMLYAETGDARGNWMDAVVDTGTIYGKLIYNPCTGTRMQPLSYDTSGSGPTPGNHIYMRQPFDLTPVPTLGLPNFTISKAFATQTPTGPSSGFNTNERVHYQLLVCNTGEAEPGIVVMTDDYASGFDFDGPYGGDCSGYGDGSPCSQGTGSGMFTTKWMRGFAGNTCVTITGKVVDYWVDSSEYCATRANWAGVHWPTGDFTPNITPDARSNTVNVTMYCPGTSTFTRTFTPTYTISQTHTITPTSTSTVTRTLIPTLTRTTSHTFSPTVTLTWTVSTTHTPHPPGTETFTPTFTRTITRTFTQTWSFTATPTRTGTFTRTPTFTVTSTWETAINLVKSESTQIAQLGDTVQYCIEFTNVGAGAATFEIWDTIPGPMDILWCTDESDGTDCDVNTFTSGVCVEYYPSGDCRVISWHMTGIPPGATGTVCFWARVARIQTRNPMLPRPEFFADARGWNSRFFNFLNSGQKGIVNYNNIRGPDRTD